MSSTNVTILELDEGFFTEGADDDTAEQLVAADTPTPVRRVRSLTRPGKVLSLWPLPGGGGAWKDTLDAMLKHIAAEAPTMVDAISWLTSSFDRVASQKTSRGYWQVLRSFGLIETQGEQVSVTPVGSEYLEDPTNTRLLEIAKARVVGIEEMLGWLSDQPMTMKELLTRFRDELGVEWQSTAQIQFRLGWLTVLGAALDDDGRWRTTRPNGAQD